MSSKKVQFDAVAFRRGKLQLVGVRTPKGIWVGDKCWQVGRKYEIFSLPADSPTAKRAFAEYNAYLERKAQKKKETEEEEGRRKEAAEKEAEERRNLFANLEPGMYLALPHYAGLGLGHVYVVGRVERIEYRKKKKAEEEKRVIYVAKYFRKSGVWDKPRPLSKFGWLLTEKQAQAVISGKKPLYSVVKNSRFNRIVHEPLEPLED